MTLIRYTKHALERMALRGISISDVESALEIHPSYRDKSGADIYIKKLNNYTLVVIAHRKGDIFRVITVYRARRIDKLIKSKVNKGSWERLG
jgi:hypothetical protein